MIAALYSGAPKFDLVKSLPEKGALNINTIFIGGGSSRWKEIYYYEKYQVISKRIGYCLITPHYL